ncbi:MAG: TIGR00266 family protein [Actinomycetales bacterium]|nr:TIGR00266 family protein [Actinomycetales bacterium]
MLVDVRHGPAFAVARCTLANTEHVKVESGAMAAMSDGVTLDAKMEGGFLKSLGRSALGGNSFFVTSYTASKDGAWVDVTAVLPGDITVIESTPERPLAVTRGSWLANEQSLAMDTKWGGANNLFGGEGGFVSRFDGAGKVVIASYGALDKHALNQGERMVIDSGHLVAYDAYIAMQAQTTGGIMKSLKSGEGIVLEITGPGLVWTQSRNPNGLITWLTNVLPFSRS